MGRCGSRRLPCLHVTFPGDSQVAGVGDETRRRAVRQHVLPASVTFSDKQPTNPPLRISRPRLPLTALVNPYTQKITPS